MGSQANERLTYEGRLAGPPAAARTSSDPRRARRHGPGSTGPLSEPCSSVCFMDLDPLPDRWHTRDFPVLLEVARAADAEQEVNLDDIAATLDMRVGQIIAVLDALEDARYLRYDGTEMLSGEVHVNFVRISERGRRVVGLWPNEEQAADALVELLGQAAEHVDDEDDAGALRRAGRLLRGVPSAVIADVTAALIRQQSGIG